MRYHLNRKKYQLTRSLRWPARLAASCSLPSIKQPSYGEHKCNGQQYQNRFVKFSYKYYFSHCHTYSTLAIPWPRGPDVASFSSMVNFRVTWVLEPQLTEVFRIVHYFYHSQKGAMDYKSKGSMGNMTSRKDKTVTVCPVTFSLWIDIHHMVPKHISRGAAPKGPGCQNSRLELPRSTNE